MKSAIVLATAMLFAPAAFAGQVVCSGEYFGYVFTVSGSSNGSKIVGSPSVTISDGSSVIKSATMTLTSSSISAGHELKFVGGMSGLGQGSLDAMYDASAGNYKGTMSADTSMGTFNIDTTCSIH